jgi:peptidoglycan/xylan/chitin deacetylase (PgdA/CDA1 family)
MVKRIDKRAWAADALRWSGAGALLRALPRWEGLLVLNYHRLGDAAASPFERDLFSATAEAFDRQIAFLKKNAEVISPGDISALRRRAAGRSVLITFDDGYRDNYDLALPILKRHGVPATFFICTGFLDRGGLAWWDEIAWALRASSQPEVPAGSWFEHALPLGSDEQRAAAIAAALRAYKLLPNDRTAAFMTALRLATVPPPPPVDPRELWMTWEMVREMRDAGMTIGAHTDTHALLGRLSPAEQEREILISRDRLTAELGAPPRSFAYPVGKAGTYDISTKRLLHAAGFAYGFNFQGGCQPFTTFDAHDVRRSHVGHGMSLPVFKAVVTLPTVFSR